MTTYAVRPPAEVGELIYVFRRDFARLRNLVSQQGPTATSEFLTGAWTFLGIGLTAAVSLAAAYSTEPGPPAWEAILLWCMLVAGLAVSAACFMASRRFKRSEEGSQERILSELDLLEYEAALDEAELEELTDAAGEEGYEDLPPVDEPGN